MTHKWIKCADQRPPDKSEIFIWKSEESEGLTKGWYFGRYLESRGVFCFGDMKAKPIKIFSHWMPEMKPPEVLDEKK